MWICHNSHQQKAKGHAKVDILMAQPLEEVLSINRTLAQQIALFVATDPPSLESDDHLVELLTAHVLDSAMGVDRDVAFTDCDFKMWLQIASQVQPVVSDGARNMIKAFYLASRHVRVSPMHGTAVVKSALDSM